MRTRMRSERFSFLRPSCKKAGGAASRRTACTHTTHESLTANCATYCDHHGVNDHSPACLATVAVRLETYERFRSLLRVAPSPRIPRLNNSIVPGSGTGVSCVKQT